MLEQERVVMQFSGKAALDIQVGDTLTICLPGGGGFLPKEMPDVNSSD
jgi:N-methylhydantoinase B/oxoprolinase/acetone carboxylase alpha subunit